MTKHLLCNWYGQLLSKQPRFVHWQAVKRIFQYIHGTSDLLFCYQDEDLSLKGYSDVEWANYAYQKSGPTIEMRA
jgi:hypothetical protein